MPAGHEDRSVRARLLAVLSDLGLVLDGSFTFPLTFEVRDGRGATVSFQIQSPSELGADPLRGLAPSLQRIVQAAPDSPETAVARKKLARLAGQTCGSNFHARIRTLIDLGLVRETSDQRVYRTCSLPPDAGRRPP